jgi:predicted RNA binding protein YcfA (HicA-like mRNA interferase family)
LADGFYKAVRDALSLAGYVYLENAKGSHEKWQNNDTKKILIVPRNLKSRHTANAILKDAGTTVKL